MPEPNPGVDDPNNEGVEAGADPKEVVLEPKGDEPNAEVVVAPKTEGFENGFACAGVENGFDDVCVCPNPGFAKGLDGVGVGVGVGAGVDMPKFIPGVD